MATVAEPRQLRIAGLGRYLPESVVTNAALEARFGLESGSIERTTGVGERRRANVDGGETAVYMGARAAREALEDADVEPASLDLIVNASGTPEQAIPDGAPLLQRALELGDSGIQSFSVHATCLSFLVALDVVASLVAVGRVRRALLVSTEVASRSVVGVDPHSEALWGDGAAAVVVTAAEPGAGSGLERFEMRTFGAGAELTEVRGGGTRLFPARAGLDDATRREEQRFAMRGPEVLRLSLRHARQFLAGFGDPGAFDLVVPHQPSRAGIDALATLGFAHERTVVTLGSLGNCVAASLPLALCEADRSGRFTPGTRALLVGTGAGLSLAGAVLVR